MYRYTLLNRMNRIDRLFGMATMLQSRKYVTTEQLAEKFGVSLRTVYRDVKALGEPNRGYFLVQGYFLPPVSFSPEEANTLLLLEKLIYGLADKSIMTQYTSVLHKVKAVLRSAEKDRLEQLTHRINMEVSAQFQQTTEHLAMLLAALSNQQVVEIDYQNKEGLNSTRRIEPIGLAYYGTAWHVIAWCHRRKAYRDFNVIRIRRLSAIGMPFRKEPHITLNDYITSLQLVNTQIA